MQETFIVKGMSLSSVKVLSNNKFRVSYAMKRIVLKRYDISRDRKEMKGKAKI